jgi:hypothetical protein
VLGSEGSPIPSEIAHSELSDAPISTSSPSGAEGVSESPESPQGSSSETEKEVGSSSKSGTTAETPGPARFFSSTSFWNTAVPANAPVDPNSSAEVDAFASVVAGELQAGSGPWIDTTSYSVPVYTVGAGQATVRVALDHSPAVPALQAAWDAVPLPADAQPAVGSDGDLVVWQPSTDRLWEFWRLVHEGSVWHASWGGAMQDASSDSGAFGPRVWPGAKSWWGVAASSLSLVGGLISLEDLEAGVIDHALSMSIPDVRAGVYASPAQRSDGKSSEPLALPEGAHLRLDPSLNLASLHLPRLTLMMAQAAQQYGIFVKDGARNVTFDAQDPTPTGTEPYGGASGYFEGQSPRGLLASFPWSHLELLKMELHKMTRPHRSKRPRHGHPTVRRPT